MKEQIASFNMDGEDFTRQIITIRKDLYLQLRSIAREDRKAKIRIGDVIDTMVRLATDTLGADRIDEEIQKVRSRKATLLANELLVGKLRQLSSEDRRALFAMASSRPEPNVKR